MTTLTKSQVWKTIKQDYPEHSLRWQSSKSDMLNYAEEQEQQLANIEENQFLQDYDFSKEPIQDTLTHIDQNTQNLQDHVDNMGYVEGDIILLKSGKIVEYKTKT